MKQTCHVCKHDLKKHNKTIHGPDGSPGPDAGKICLEIVGSIPFGNVTCSCNGKRAHGLEILKK